MVDTVLSGGWIIDGTRTPPIRLICVFRTEKLSRSALSGRVIAARGWMSPEKSSLPVLLTFTPILIPVHFLLSFRKVK